MAAILLGLNVLSNDDQDLHCHIASLGHKVWIATDSSVHRKLYGYLYIFKMFHQENSYPNPMPSAT